MPPKDSRLDEISPTALLPLQDWLKLLSARGVDMRVAMGLAAKMYNSHNTKERLETLNAKKLMTVIPDKEARRSVVNAVKGISTGPAKSKKRTRDSDLMEPLHDESQDIPDSLEFNPITTPEDLIPVSVTVNRSPVKTAWVYTVALRMGFDHQEALSIAHVYVHLSSLKHALMLGNILNKQETKEAEEELAELPADEGHSKWKGKGREKNGIPGVVGSSQPWVGILKARWGLKVMSWHKANGRIPVIERPDGTWRAIQQGLPVQPSVAYLYITRAFKDYTPHIMGSLKLLAESYTADELNRTGMHMYNAFKPDTTEWGQKATLECAKILNQLKTPLKDDGDDIEVMARAEAVSVSATGEAAGDGVGEGKGKAKPVSTELLDGPGIPDDLSDLSDPPPLAGDEAESEARAEIGEAEVEDEEVNQPPAKKQMTLEEYEAMLDAEDMEGGFLEAGDIY